jgi:hypothetical protein
MSQWLQDLTAGWPMIAANLPTFIAIIAIIFGAIWAAFSWSYGSVIRSKDAEIRSKNAEIELLERHKSLGSESNGSMLTLTNDDYSGDPEAEALDKDAYNRIVAFCIDDLLSSCEAQVKLQESIIRNSSDNETLSELAIAGLHSEWKYKTRGFWENYTNLSSGLTDSPGPSIRFDKIIECIHELEREFYRNFCEQGTALASAQNIDLEHGPAIREWNQWRDAHLRMVTAYEPIKRDIRFGKLHRLKPSR